MDIDRSVTVSIQLCVAAWTLPCSITKVQGLINYAADVTGSA